MNVKTFITMGPGPVIKPITTEYPCATVFGPGKPLQLILIFMSKARSGTLLG